MSNKRNKNNTVYYTNITEKYYSIDTICKKYNITQKELFRILTYNKFWWYEKGLGWYVPYKKYADCFIEIGESHWMTVNNRKWHKATIYGITPIGLQKLERYL